ncbi:MAG: hypothetical protein M1817_006101 [Caeruleum heppii]|nr:MAG: hypothetical protein M1817_006101 [Caeruleum heppii]
MAVYERSRKRRRPAGRVDTSEPLRKAPRLPKRRVSQEVECVNTSVRLSPGTASTRQNGRQEHLGPESKSLQTRGRSQDFKDESQDYIQSLSTSTAAPKHLKRYQSTPESDTLIRHTKYPRRNDTGDPIPKIKREKANFIESWLSTSSWSRQDLIANESLPQTPSKGMPPDTGEVLPSPDTRSSIALASSSRRSEKTAVSVHDANFRDSLRYRKIYINREDPPVELMRRAKRITTRPRTSPDIDDATARKLRDTARRLESEGEQVIVQELVPHLFPVSDNGIDRRLARNANQVWRDAVPVPLDPNMLANPLALPRPKPDIAFGYSEAAFDPKQLMTIDLLIDQFGRSYAVPDDKLRFPFLGIEIKSQAKGGTHFIATNQVANAGSIAMNGSLELPRRTVGVGQFDSDEPQFFSLSMDHALACLNVHWLSGNAEDGSFSFHMEGLSKHVLDDVDGLRAVRRAVKNILDYGANERLRTLCEALDAYRQKVVAEREMAISEKDRTTEVQVESQERRPRRRDTRTRPLPNRRQEEESQGVRHVQGDITKEDEAEESQE